MQRDLAALIDIAHAARMALDFIQFMSWPQFRVDLKTQSAVMHQVIIIGEATRRTSINFRLNHPHLPWPQMMGMRNRLIHEYDEVNLDLLWSTLQQDLPELLKCVEPLIEKEH